MRWIWVRHGRTAANVMKRYIGHLDEPLDEVGVDQADRLAEAFRDFPITRIYSSDLRRAQATASAIAQVHQQNPILTPALRELNFGDWEGKSYEEIAHSDALLLSRWLANPCEIAPPNGERLEELGARFDRWLRSELGQMQEEGTYLFVTHGGPIRWFLSQYAIPKRSFWDVTVPTHGDSLVLDVICTEEGFRYLSQDNWIAPSM
ncbi:histidine phosphatase family protein [Thermicanus aegyptius]|uniref:histidine phosphatase family protein n=1 Tax=Thermicanus aegyptius TaxID=94009 RepID=UPI0003FF1F7E|nr:histidine phosphatase family protein [Thermicanus aegyptius]